MKFSINSIRRLNNQYKLSADTTKTGLDNLVKIIGAQLGEIDDVSAIGDKYRGIIIAEVKSCIKHPNADKLSVCKIDDGGKAENVERDEDGLVQVVCGAPNVREGIFVAWLPPGVTVPETFETEPFVLGSRELRGVVSNGMLASSKELALGDSHDGILVIDGSSKVGSDFAKTYGLEGDQVIDVENKMFTHRPDCFGLLGIARELAGIQGIAFKSPEWYQTAPAIAKPSGKTLPLKITNDIPELCQRFSAIVISGVEVKPSPVWLQVELAKVGLKPINNIVDYTNYFSYLTAQPLHAYDYDKVAAMSGGQPTINVRKPNSGEAIKLLNSKTIEPWKEAIMIASDKQLLGLGGVMGGSESEVDSNTKNIILESANFDMYTIRRTSMQHGLFTDAVTRFNKGQSPLQTLTVLAHITDEILKNAGGKIASQVYDLNYLKKSVIDNQTLHSDLDINTEFINSRLGMKLSVTDISKLLSNVEFKVNSSGQKLKIKAPFWRTDIECPEDIVEEVGRLHGYDKAEQLLPMRRANPVAKNQLLSLKTKIRSSLAKAGANEILSYSFLHGRILEQAMQDPSQAYKLANALSPDLQYYRLSLTPSLLDIVHPNIKAGYEQFAIYEIGKTHALNSVQPDGLPAEDEVLALVISSGPKTKQAGAAYYRAKKFLSELASDFNIELEFKRLSSKDNSHTTKPYDDNRSAIVKIQGMEGNLGLIGEFKPQVRRNFKLPIYSAGFEINLTKLLEASSKAKSGYQTLSRFPKVTQDITLKAPLDLAYGTLFESITKNLSGTLADTIFSISPISIYQAKATDKTKNYTFRLSITNFERTLTDKEVNKLLDQLTQKLAKKHSVSRV